MLMCEGYVRGSDADLGALDAGDMARRTKEMIAKYTESWPGNDDLGIDDCET